MPVIEVNGLTKAFRTYKKQPGFARRGQRAFPPAIRANRRRQRRQLSRLNPANSSVSSARTARARPPRSKCSPACFIPPAARRRCSATCRGNAHDGYRRQFALVLGQKNQLWWDLPARESLELNAKIYGIPADRFERTVAEMSELLAVRDKLNVSVRELSLGERMKMELIASLLHQPKVLFLDEPTIGLDVVSQKTVREFIRRHNAEQKTTILLTSHYMADIQELCERVIIIDHGKIFFDGKLERNRGPLCRFQTRHDSMRQRGRRIRRKIWRATAKSWRKTPAPSRSRSNATA